MSKDPYMSQEMKRAAEASSLSSQQQRPQLSVPPMNPFHNIDASVSVEMRDTNVQVTGPNSTFNQQNGPVINIGTTGRNALEIIQEKLKHAPNAKYSINTGVTRDACTQGTRTIVLNKISRWASSLGAPLYWMNGMAGTGKTTIVYSASHQLEENDQLGATFFCSRSLDDCQSVQIILPTIAYQLAHKYPEFAERLAQTVFQQPDLHRHHLDVQIRKLIIEPWAAGAANLPSNVVVVIDALDECRDDHSNFLHVLFSTSHSLPFKVLVTSRPEPTIYTMMTQKASLSETLSTFVLHDVEKDLVQADIATYLTSKLAPHVDAATIQFLADMSGKLFVFAATLVRFLTDKGADISIRLELLRTTLPIDTKREMVELLDELYKGILREALRKGMVKREVEETKGILNDIICARRPLTRRAIAGLWNIREEQVEQRLNALRSVLLIPLDHRQPITVFHASFPDFMLDESRSGHFCCIAGTSHCDLVERCLTVMITELRHNLCSVKGRPENMSIPEEMIASSISPSLQYAAVHWADHFMFSTDSKKRSAPVTKFVTEYVLQWFECLSLLGKLGVGIRGLELVEPALEKDNVDLANLVYESLRLIQYLGVYDIVKRSAMEIYYTALAWTPTQSFLREHYTTFYDKAPCAHCGLPATWTGPYRIIDIHSKTVYSIAISQDGDRIVSGSADRTVRVWNLRTQVEECVFTGHTDEVNCVAISQDGTLIISGSDDKTVRVWNTTTNECNSVLTAPHRISAVAISPNNKWIASGDQFGYIHIWDATNLNNQQAPLIKQHDTYVCSVSFAPNGTLLASGSSDGTARIQNVRTLEILCTLSGHNDEVRAVAWSPDGKMIITGSYDKTARLWDMKGKTLQTLRGHSDWVMGVAFLPDGKRVVTASDEGTFRIWSVPTGDMVQNIAAAGRVQSFAVFPDGMRIASCSNNLISVWRLTSGAVQSRTRNDKSLPVLRAKWIALSSDGKWLLLFPSLHIFDTATLKKKSSILSLTTNYTNGAWSKSAKMFAASGHSKLRGHVVDVWRVSSGVIVGRSTTLRGHTEEITSVSFSHNERLLVSTSFDNTARIWNLAEGKTLYVLPHSDEVYHASFSYNDLQLVVIDRSRRVLIWNASSGDKLRLLDRGTYISRNSSTGFTSDDQYFFLSRNYDSNVKIWNAKTYELTHELEDFCFWQTFEDGTSCALRDDGWVCYFINLSAQPQRLLWIPPSYQPHRSYVELKLQPYGSNSIFSSSSEGIHISILREEGLLFLTIPRVMITRDS